MIFVTNKLEQNRYLPIDFEQIPLFINSLYLMNKKRKIRINFTLYINNLAIIVHVEKNYEIFIFRFCYFLIQTY